jgi:hypothetical protein
MIRTIHGTLRATLAAAVTLTALTSAPAAHADSHWHPLSGIPVEGTPAVAISETQVITVAAAQTRPRGGGVLVTTRSPDGSWSMPVHLGTTAWASTVRVATNARGDVVVGWDDGVQHIAVRPTGQAFLPTVDLPNSTDSVNIDGPTPQVGVNDAGEVTTAWIAKADADDHSLPSADAVRYTTGSLTAPVQTVHTSADGNTSRTFQLRTAHQGPSALVWGGDLGVSAVVRRAGEDFGAVQHVTPAGVAMMGPAVGDPVVAVRADGRAAVAFEGSEDGSAPNRVELSRTGADGVFEPATFVTPPGQDTTGPGLAWAAGSAIQLGWQGSADHSDAAVTAVAPADGPLGVPEQDTYEPVESEVGIQVLGSAGGALTFFQRTDGGMRSVLWTPPNPAAPEPEAVVSPEPADWKGPSVAGDDAGDAVATWSPRATPWLPAVAVWDVTAPAVTVTAPATVTAGQPFTLTVGATDALSGIASRAVTFTNAFGAPIAGPPVDADGSAQATFSQPGTYTLTAGATDNDGNSGTATRTITAVAPAEAPVVVKSTCRVPSLRNHSVAYAKRLLRVWRCRLGRVTTPKRYKHVKGLVIRAQSRPAGQKPTAGAHVNVTLGVKPKRSKHAKQEGDEAPH